jgi:hypothetical protein
LIQQTGGCVMKRFDIVFEVVISGSAGGMGSLSGEVRQ